MFLGRPPLIVHFVVVGEDDFRERSVAHNAFSVELLGQRVKQRTPSGFSVFVLVAARGEGPLPCGTVFEDFVFAALSSPDVCRRCGRKGRRRWAFQFGFDSCSCSAVETVAEMTCVTVRVAKCMFSCAQYGA